MNLPAASLLAHGIVDELIDTLDRQNAMYGIRMIGKYDIEVIDESGEDEARFKLNRRVYYVTGAGWKDDNGLGWELNNEMQFVVWTTRMILSNRDEHGAVDNYMYAKLERQAPIMVTIASMDDPKCFEKIVKELLMGKWNK